MFLLCCWSVEIITFYRSKVTFLPFLCKQSLPGMMHHLKCSIHLDICHVNSSEVGATHSCCCVLQCVHYSMERRDAELISMATGLNDRTRAKENLPPAAEAFQKGASAARSSRLAGQVCEAAVATVAFK